VVVAAILLLVLLALLLAWQLSLSARLGSLAARIEALERARRRSESGEPAPLAPVAPAAAAPPALRPAIPLPAPPRRAADAASVEQLIGGVWLQNVGAVVLLLGLFLMIVWGYTTHRLGPQALVASGVVLGLALVWRGDRVARRVASFGQALIGLGLGAIYIALDLGYVRLHVLAMAPTFALLSLTSLGAILAGLRHRVPVIAALGVVGAFLPQFMAAWLGLGGFRLEPWPLLAYLAIVDGLVFVLAARAGWSGLDLAALALSALAWGALGPGAAASWPHEIALAALFAFLGLAPLPRLARTEGRVRAADLAVVAAPAPGLLLASWAFLAARPRGEVAMLLFSLAALELAASLWVDARRPERDLWAPLTGAASLFLAAALERALGEPATPFAWCAEGAVLIALGLRPRGGWLRAWGSIVLVVGACGVLFAMFAHAIGHERAGRIDGVSLGHLAGIALVLLAGAMLAAGRARLTTAERLSAEGWGAAGNVLLLVWIALAARDLAPDFAGGDRSELRTLDAALTSGGWLLQAVALLATGWLRGSAFLRWCGLALLGFTLLKFLIVDLQTVDVFWRFLTAIAVGAAMLALSYAYQRRQRGRG